MFTISNFSFSPATRLASRAGLAACVLLATACHGGLDTPTGPSPSLDALSATIDDQAADSTRRMTYDMVEVNASGYSGTCTLAAARTGFRLKAQGVGTPGNLIYFHLIKADGFRTTGIADVSRQGTFRIGQELVDYFPPNADVRCVLLAVDGTLLAESTTFTAP